MKILHVFLTLSLLVAFSSCSKDDDNAEPNTGDTNNDTLTGDVYYVTEYHDTNYVIEDGDSMVMAIGSGSNFNDAYYRFDGDVLYTHGTFLITWDYYMLGHVYSTQSETMDMNNPYPSGYNIDDSTGTIQIGAVTYIYSNYNDDELEITFFDNNVDTTGEGTYYIQTWELAK